MLFKRLGITLVVFFSILFNFNVYAAELFLGGDSIGIDLNYNGIIITGTYNIKIDGKSYDPSHEGYCEGDLITHVNGKKVETINELTKEIEKRLSMSQKIMLTYLHDHQRKTSQLFIQNKDNQFSTGLYVADGISGVGTLTYYNPSNQHYGALGHMMMDTSLKTSVENVKGSIYQAKITDIIKSQINDPGEKIADISYIHKGNITDNNQYGIYGEYDKDKVKNKQVISSASIDEITLGKAYFYTVINGEQIEKYEINITHLKKQDKCDVKGISFEVVDQRIMKSCNGIIQGMSGSPIVQNGKLIGCVTHVDVNDPHKGYGLYIEWMLENDK